MEPPVLQSMPVTSHPIIGHRRKESSSNFMTPTLAIFLSIKRYFFPGLIEEPQVSEKRANKEHKNGSICLFESAVGRTAQDGFSEAKEG